VSPTTVGKARAQLSSSGQLAEPDKRTGADGKARSRPARPAAKPASARVTDAEFEDIGPPLPFAGAGDPAPATAPPAEVAEQPQLTGDALLSAALASDPVDGLAAGDGGEAGAAMSTIPATVGAAEAPSASCAPPEPPASEALMLPPLDVVKELVRALPTDQLEEFKNWFREYTGAAVISESAAETIPAKRGRGRPNGDADAVSHP
jgi:hypothetical protein